MASLPAVACFGEILWDVLPSGKQPGGAPFNVAVHLHQLGQPVRFISRVGADAWGTELRVFVEPKVSVQDSSKPMPRTPPAWCTPTWPMPTR
jgi:sugar/nucleoside kinase (ribokinase family)